MKKLVLNQKILLLLFFFLLFLNAYAKDYSLEKAEVFMHVLPDATIKVEEKITFNFSGNFSFAFREIPLGYWQLKNIKVTENNASLPFELTETNNNIRITWHFNASNEKRTFTITYDLIKAISAYNDVAELNWKVWGSNWSKPLKEIYGFIELPSLVENPKEIYVFGHPEINGKLGLIENKKILFQGFSIPANQFVEVRIVFPVSMLSSKENAIIRQGNGLQVIIQEEENYVKRNKDSFFYLLIGFFFFFAELIAFIFVWYFFGREPKILEESIYEREIPFDYSPAIVSALINQFYRKPDLKSITAEILDLCLKGKLKLEEIKKQGFFSQTDYLIHIINDSFEDLPESEAMILRLISEAAKVKIKGLLIPSIEKDETPNALLLSELKKYLAINKQKTRFFALAWQESVKRAAESMDFFSNKNGFIPFAIISFFIIIIGSLLIIISGFSFNLFYPFLVIIEASILCALFPNALPNRTEKGAEHYIKWMKLKKFLKDFSNLKNTPPSALPLWEKYLVYSIPLGVAKEVQKTMNFVFKDYSGEMHSSIFVSSKAFNSSVLINSINSFSQSFSSAFASAVSTSGSSGFSGGGGSGGGGGGGGAG